jgi:hypothetical protein
VNTDMASAEYVDDDVAAASYTPVPTPSPHPSTPADAFFAPSPPVPPASSQRRRPSWTDTEEYNWMESLPKARAKTPHATPSSKTAESPKSKPSRAPDAGYEEASYVPYRVVERRVIVAVTLKVLAELK